MLNLVILHNLCWNIGQKRETQTIFSLTENSLLTKMTWQWMENVGDFYCVMYIYWYCTLLHLCKQSALRCTNLCVLLLVCLWKYRHSKQETLKFSWDHPGAAFRCTLLSAFTWSCVAFDEKFKTCSLFSLKTKPIYKCLVDLRAESCNSASKSL